VYELRPQATESGAGCPWCLWPVSTYPAERKRYADQRARALETKAARSSMCGRGDEEKIGLPQWKEPSLRLDRHLRPQGRDAEL